LVFTPFPKSITRFLYFVVGMCCCASTRFCRLKTIVDKQDITSVVIKNNPKVKVVLLVLTKVITPYNIQLVF